MTFKPNKDGGPRLPFLDRNPASPRTWLVLALVVAVLWGFVAGLFAGSLIVGGF